MPNGGDMDKLHRALNTSFAQLDTDTMAILNDLMPDNPDFLLDDAQAWYRRLGLFDSGSIPLDSMKAAIRQKQSWATVPLEMQSEDYIEGQLRDAGFDVYVYKNKFSDGMGGWETQTPDQVLGTPAGLAELGAFNLNVLNLGSRWGDEGISIIVDYLEEENDINFDFGSNYRSTFYVASDPITTFADVPLSRKLEFRQLLLKLKAAHMAGFLFVNYV